MMFLSTVGQSLGPEMLMKFIHPEEAIKRLAASVGIDTLKLIKTMEEQQAELGQMQQQQMIGNLTGQAGQLAKAPLMDPDKNPQLIEGLTNALQPQQPAPEAGPDAQGQLQG
jgi:hypothetical protein